MSRGWLSVLLLLFLAVPAVAQPIDAVPQAQSEDQKPSTEVEPSKDVVMTFLGARIAIDPATGRLRPLRAEEARELARGLEKLLNRSDKGLKVQTLSDGSDVVDLEDRFANAVIAFADDDGLHFECVTTAAEAAAAMVGKPGSTPKDGE